MCRYRKNPFINVKIQKTYNLKLTDNAKFYLDIRDTPLYIEQQNVYFLCVTFSCTSSFGGTKNCLL